MQMYSVVPEEFMERDTRMTLLQDNCIAQYGGKLKAGTCVVVPEQVARRWRQKGIAVDSAESDKTLIEQKQARIAAMQAEVEELKQAEAAFAQSIGGQTVAEAAAKVGKR